MNRKGITWAVVLIIFGVYFLSLHLIFNFTFDYAYTQLAIALLFVLGGLSILIRLQTRMYRHYPTPPAGMEFRMLSSNVFFFILEFSKVTAAVLLAMEYPLEGFIVFLVLDILDGWILPHEKRSLILRHKIDKFTDALCQVPFYIVAIQLWPQWFVLITIFFSITIIKTALFIKTGNKNWLIYLPGFLLVFHFFALVLMRFFNELYIRVFTDLYASMIFIIIVMVLTVSYEVIYNGVMYSIRYKREGHL